MILRFLTLILVVCVAKGAAGRSAARADPLPKAVEVAAPIRPTQAFDPRPYLREILGAQDRIASGDASAVGDLAASQSSANTAFWSADTSVWSGSGSIHALLVFTLVGGDQRVLRRAVAAGVVPTAEQGLTEGVVALLAGKEAIARERLLPHRSSTELPLLWSVIGLSLAPLLASTDTKLAFGLLDEARLLAPSTLIEETSLRRTIALQLDLGRPVDALTTLRRYVWRFPRSLYAPQLIESACIGIARLLPREAEPPLLSLMGGMPPHSRAFDPLVLSLIREFTLAGRLDAARALIDFARSRPDPTSVTMDRLRFYQLAGNVNHLNAVERNKLTEHDRGILLPRDATLLDLAVHAVRSLPSASASPRQTAPTLRELDTSDVLRRATKALESSKLMFEVRR